VILWLKRVFPLINRLWILALVAIGVLALGLMLRPRPVFVDLAVVELGKLQLTVQDDGRTRIREKYVVSTPVSGRLIRIDWKPGDSIFAGETTLAVIEPTDPTLLDPRALAESRARVKAAEARLSQIEPQLEFSIKRLEFTETEFNRNQNLAEKNVVSQQALKEAALALNSAQAQHAEALFAKTIAEYELRMAKAVLIHTQDPVTAEQEEYTGINPYRFPVLSPISGKVLRVMQESATIVMAGAPLLELGDPTDLEIELDVLSTDAVKIKPGARVAVEHWGGEHPLAGTVRLIEPSAFTKVSALGIEEQRVNVIIDFDRNLDLSALGDGYRVEAAIVIWESDDVLKVPIGALYRRSSDWAVLINQNGRAEERIVTIGQRNDREAQVLDGLQPGIQVVLHPGDRLSHGSRLKQREL
jgi:HlyD family secretion protein